MGKRVFWGTIISLFLLSSWASCRTLVTIESQKARLTLALLSRLIKLEDSLKDRSPVKVLVLLPQIRTAFQDQNIVNEAVKDFFRENREFEAYFVSDPEKALDLLKNEHFHVVYVAGPFPQLEKILTLAASQKVLTVSHLPEFLRDGLALALDLDRRKACIVVNEDVWQKLELDFPPQVLKKFSFVSFGK